jgi:hypothetical protein
MRPTPPGYFTVRWSLPEYTDWIDEFWADYNLRHGKYNATSEADSVMS